MQDSVAVKSARNGVRNDEITDACGCIDSSCEACLNPSVCGNCVDCCCADSHKDWRRNAIRRGLVVQYFNSIWMTVEVTVTMMAGFAAANFALLAFGSDSMIELISGVVVLLHLRKDDSGLNDAGERTSRLSRLLLFILIPVIALGASYSYFTGLKPETSVPGLVVAVIAVAVMPFFWLEKKKIGKDTNCLPLKIDALESATCLAMSVVLLAGLALQFLLHSYWAVYIALGFMLAFIAKEAVESSAKHLAGD